MNKPICLCGASDYTTYHYRSQNKDFEVLACRRCHLARTWPVPLAGKGLEEYYEDQEDYKDRFAQLELWQKFAQRTLTIAQKYVPSGRLLDVGCNVGIFVAEAKRNGYDAHGVDLSHKAIEYGQTKLGLTKELSIGTIAEHAYADDSWDVITYIHCFEYLEYPEDEMKEARRILKPGGILVIEVPRFFSVWRAVLGNRWYCFSPHQHIWQCGKRGVENILLRSGFEIVVAKTRINLRHDITPTIQGVFKILLSAIAWLSGTGDNLIMIARKK